MILVAASEQEPRFQVSASLDAAQVFGVDVDGLAPGEVATVGGGATTRCTCRGCERIEAGASAGADLKSWRY